MMTQGEMEAAVCEGISRFEQEYMGRGPKEVRCFLIDDLLLVRRMKESASLHWHGNSLRIRKTLVNYRPRW